MGEPMTKERLSNYIKLKAEVEQYLERVARMKSEEKFPAMRESDGSQHQPGNSDRMVNAILRRMDFQEKELPLINANLDEMEAIEQAIYSLPDPQERAVLKARYMDGDCGRQLPWRDVAISLFRDDDERHMQATFRLHGRALQNIEKRSMNR